MVIVISLKNVAEVNTLKLKNNLNSVKRTLRSGVGVCAVVKADAYGHGAVGVARCLDRHVDSFAVSLVAEGIELRISGIKRPILVLIPTDFEGICRASAYGLSLTVGSFDDIKNLELARKTRDITFRCHIKINTGMNRFGFEVGEVEHACRMLKRVGVFVEGCFSHFSCPQDEAITQAQFESFSVARGVVASFFKEVCYHISASGGILCGKKYNLDMVRPGLLLYGYLPFESNALSVDPVMKIYSKNLICRKIRKGSNLLYGEYDFPHSGGVSIVRTGYADGFSRKENNIYNARCMDVSAVAQSSDSELVTFSNADEVAVATGRISYDVLCSITKRARIIYKE